MKLTATTLMLWINANSVYDYTGEPPRIVITDPESLVYLMLGEIHLMPERAKRGLMGLYDPGTETIWLRDDFDAGDPEHRSHLLHELVHFVQYRQADHGRLACGRELEREAYRIQNAYLATQDLPPVREMGAGFSQAGPDCETR